MNFQESAEMPMIAANWSSSRSGSAPLAMPPGVVRTITGKCQR